MNDIVSVCECSVCSKHTDRWGNLSHNCYNQIPLNFLYSEAMGMLKHQSLSQAV